MAAPRPLPPQFQKSHGSKEGSDDKRPSVGAMLEGPPVFLAYTTVTVTE